MANSLASSREPWRDQPRAGLREATMAALGAELPCSMQATGTRWEQPGPMHSSGLQDTVTHAVLRPTLFILTYISVIC